MKQFILMIFFFIPVITLQTRAMEMELDKINASTSLLETSENTAKYQNNSVTLPPIINVQNNGINLSVKSSFPIEKKETHEKRNEYEIISLDDTKNIEEDYSSKCQSCCIPLTKEKIATLTEKNIDINLYQKNKCKKRTFIGTLVGFTILYTSIGLGYLIWSAIYDCGFLMCPNNTRVPIVCRKPFPHC